MPLLGFICRSTFTGILILAPAIPATPDYPLASNGSRNWSLDLTPISIASLGVGVFSTQGSLLAIVLKYYLIPVSHEWGHHSIACNMGVPYHT